MPSAKTIRILLIEDNVLDEQLVREALAEIEEGPRGRTWNVRFELLTAGDLDFGLELLGEARFDLILLNLTLPDAPALLETFSQVQAAARQTPILILEDEEDEALAVRLIRQGAADYLLKSELDCEPLARALRYALERNRSTEALRSLCYFDELTSLYNSSGFVAVCDLHQRITPRLVNPLLVGLAEITGFPESMPVAEREQRDMVLVDAAEVLRHCFPESLVSARLSSSTFGLLLMDTSEADFDLQCEQLELHVRAGYASRGGRHSLHLRFTSVPLQAGPSALQQISETQRSLHGKPVMLAS